MQAADSLRLEVNVRPFFLTRIRVHRYSNEHEIRAMKQAALAARAFVLLLALVGQVSGKERRVPLLNVSAGQLPNDTAFEGRSKLTIKAAPKQLGGKALEVIYAPGDSFGMSRGASEKNWKPFARIEFSVFNPARRAVALSFGVRHGGSTGYPTRIDMPVTVEPGKSVLRLAVDQMKNVNGSTPNLSDVRHWYFACEPGQAPTLYFSDIWLVSGGRPAPAKEPSGRRLRDGKNRDRLARIRAAKIPRLTRTVMFDTPEADAILSALEVFPPDNAFNQAIDDWPLHPNSKNIVASIGADKPLRYNPDMAFVLVPPDQARVAVKIIDYPHESDPGPYPIPRQHPH